MAQKETQLGNRGNDQNRAFCYEKPQIFLMRSPRGLCSWPHGPSEVPVFEDPAKITLAHAKNNSDLSFYIKAENAPISTLFQEGRAS